MLKFNVILLLCFAWACTPPPRPPLVIAWPLQQYFASCYPSEGSLHVGLPLGQGKVPVPAQLDWIAFEYPNWHLQLSDPLGRILVEIKREKDQVVTAGSLQARLPQLALDSDGFIEANSFFVGLKANELPCLLNMTLPSAWLAKVSERQLQGERERLILTEAQREISLDFIRHGSKTVDKICAEIRWRHIWGFKSSKLNWCFEPDKKQSMMKLPMGQRLNWMKVDA